MRIKSFRCGNLSCDSFILKRGHQVCSVKSIIMPKRQPLKWSAAFPSRRPDKIISSDNRARGDMFGFSPSYEDDPYVNMNFIMTNEYLRLWFQERGKYEHVTYSQLESLKGESDIRRRFVQRDISSKKKVKPFPKIVLKQFENVKSKTDHRRPRPRLPPPAQKEAE